MTIFARLKRYAMILIIDAGSTKMEWALVENGEVKARFTTQGFNPNYSDPRLLGEMLDKQLPEIVPNDLQSVYYYGTGCGAEKNCAFVANAFQKRFAHADIHVTHDLMAAAHAVLGNERGIACILGTGANACVYDGKQIVEKAVSLGFMVGDEGSGGHIGRSIVRSYFYGFMPDELKAQFRDKYPISVNDFVAQLYHNSQPSRYLASFASFACEHQDHPFVAELCRKCFDAFAEAFICRFNDYKSLKVSFVGSVAYHFSGILQQSLASHGIIMGEVLQAPMDGLVKYHTLN